MKLKNVIFVTLSILAALVCLLTYKERQRELFDLSVGKYDMRSEGFGQVNVFADSEGKKIHMQNPSMMSEYTDVYFWKDSDGKIVAQGVVNLIKAEVDNGVLNHFSLGGSTTIALYFDKDLKNLTEIYASYKYKDCFLLVFCSSGEKDEIIYNSPKPNNLPDKIANWDDWKIEKKDGNKWILERSTYGEGNNITSFNVISFNYVLADEEVDKINQEVKKAYNLSQLKLLIQYGAFLDIDLTKDFNDAKNQIAHKQLFETNANYRMAQNQLTFDYTNMLLDYNQELKTFCFGEQCKAIVNENWVDKAQQVLSDIFAALPILLILFLIFMAGGPIAGFTGPILSKLGELIAEFISRFGMIILIATIVDLILYFTLNYSFGLIYIYQFMYDTIKLIGTPIKALVDLIMGIGK